MIGNRTPNVGRLWDNETARQLSPPGRYTPLVPRPEGGADRIMVAQFPRPSTTLVVDWPPPQLPVNEIQQWALDAAERGVQTARRLSVMPLYCFNDRHLERIRWDVEQDQKPGFWLQLEFAQIPSRAWSEWHWQRGIDPERIRKPLDPATRRFVIERDGYVCGICQGDVEPTDVHIDHIYPVVRGGDDDPDNLRVTHSVCNLKKGARVDA